jgi:uncharacterized protein (DUF1499 family)
MKKSNLPVIGLLLGADTALTALLGAGLAYFAVVAPFVGFVIFLLALPMGVVALIVGVVSLRRSQKAGGVGRGSATRGIALAGITLAVILLPVVTSPGVPRINDITTDTENPPDFIKATTYEANRGRDMSYPGEEFAAQQREAYPDLEPFKIPILPEKVFERLRSALTELPGTEVTDADPESGRIEGSSTSRLFRFVDDVVIRVRPYGEGRGAGSLVDIRSKSRDGQSDFGVNAERIRALLSALR